MEIVQGQKFTRLTVVRHIGKTKHGATQWLCLCDCGKTKTVLGHNLKGHYTQSCGCLQKERAATTQFRHGAHRRHGQSWPEYHVWWTMVQRCRNPNVKSYASYGAKGITVCERWQKFENFISDMGRRGSGLTIERIDNSKGYEPGNCKWATRFDQIKNRRNAVFVEYQGKRIFLADLARLLGIQYKTLYARYKRGTQF